jgi:hypothetical protein
MFLASRMRNQGYNVSSVGYYNPIRIKLSLMSLKNWRISLGRPYVVTISISIRKIVLRIGRERIRVDFRRRDLNQFHIRI